jgi:hypothetical protein
MRTIFPRLAGIAVLAVAVVRGAPARASLEHDVYLEYGRTTGHAPGALATGELRGFPLTRSTLDLRYRVQGLVGRITTGTPVLVWGGVTAGRLLDEQISTPPTVAHESGLRLGASAGTLLALVLRERLLVALNLSTDFWGSRGDWWAGDSFLVAFAGGVEVVYGAKDLNGRFRYDVVPFWLGTDRIEHRLDVSLGVFGVSLHGGLTLGQQRVIEGGFNERTISVGLGWRP